MTDVDTNGRTCATCGETSPADANWCEACGGDLDKVPAPPKQPCVSCSAAAVEITDDGWCQVCGQKQPDPSDHVVADHGWFAVVSDRGITHLTNEDAGAVAARQNGVVLVVCDGVSSTDESHHAAQAGAAAVANTVGPATTGHLIAAITSGALAAQSEIVTLTPPTYDQPPSCTLVAAGADIADDQAELTIGWLGDSRAYWIADDGAKQLTTDHSWANEQLELGASPDQVAADQRAHSITRWLGADAPSASPEFVQTTVPLPGTLLVCSDGLWNYAPTEAEIFALITAGPDLDTDQTAESAADAASETMLQVAERLVAFANTKGGRDNITVAVARLESRGQPQQGEHADDPSTDNSSSTDDPSTDDDIRSEEHNG